jgi:hypothetical protein
MKYHESRVLRRSSSRLDFGRSVGGLQCIHKSHPDLGINQQFFFSRNMFSSLALLALVAVGHGKEGTSKTPSAGNMFRDPSVEYQAKFRYW